MAVTGNFLLRDYTSEKGVWRLHFENLSPGPGNATDYYVDILETELPANINQVQLAALLKTRLGYTYNATFAPLNTFISAGAPVTLP